MLDWIVLAILGFGSFVIFTLVNKCNPLSHCLDCGGYLRAFDRIYYICSNCSHLFELEYRKNLIYAVRRV